MKKAVLFTMFLLLALLVKPTYAVGQKVCVDPGHGGSDAGAAYKGITEAQETLDIAQRLQTLLINAGYSIVMTRTDMTTTLTNSQRAAICNTAKANILVSIHLNASADPTVDYTLGLYGKPLKDKAFTQTVNTAMNALGIANKGITNFADGVLIKSTMPATLVETVFLTSDTEYTLLTDGTGNRQQQIAQALRDGVVSWFGGK